MDAVAVAVAWIGAFVIGGAWAAVRLRGASIWAAMGWTVGPLGLLALLTGEVEAGGGVLEALLGAGVGLALYAATAAFLFLVRGWARLEREAHDLYGRRRGRSLGAALAIACLVVAPAEEALWRGLVQGGLSEVFGEVRGAASAWGLYVLPNLVSGSVPIVLGAAVGGAVWAALALWTGGVVASVACHVVWTGLMILRPPIGEGFPR